METNYLKDIQINESSLDVEWLQQPSLIFQYSKLSIDAKAKMDKQNERVALVKADLDRDIRTTPENYDITVKITEAVVSNTILIQDEYQEEYQKYIDLKYEYDIVQAALRALQDKKSALENLVKLHGQNYFAGPSVPRDLSKEWARNEHTKSSNEKVVIRRKTN